jgi:hypothetical protein
LRDGRHQLELRQIGAMIFAVPELQQPFGRDLVIAVRGGAVETDAADGDLIHFTRPLPQIVLQRVPIGLMETTQDNAEAIVVELDGTEGLAQERFQRVGVSLRPVLDGGLAVVGLGEEEGDPGSRQGAVAEALVEVVGAEVAVEQFRQA